MDLADRFRQFARAIPPDSALYRRLAHAVAEDHDLLGIAEQGYRRRFHPTLFFAAVHLLLLSGAGDETARDLARFYPSLGGEAAGDPAPAFRAFCLAQREAIVEIVRTRGTQTNEVARCASVLPAIALAAANRPITLIEIGASAGLNLLLDRYRYDYGPAGSVGDPSSPVRIVIEPRGPRLPPVPDRLPVVARRTGIDLHPIDPKDPAERQWLRACVWPDHLDRLGRLEAALDLAARDPVRVLAGNALDLLPHLLDDVDRDSVPVVLHANTLAYFSHDETAGLISLLSAAGGRRELHWVFCEGLPVTRRLAELPQELMKRAEEREIEGFTSLVGSIGFVGAERSERILALAGPHGGWIGWL